MGVRQGAARGSWTPNGCTIVHNNNITVLGEAILSAENGGKGEKRPEPRRGSSQRSQTLAGGE